MTLGYYKDALPSKEAWEPISAAILILKCITARTGIALSSMENQNKGPFSPRVFQRGLGTYLLLMQPHINETIQYGTPQLG